MGNVQKKRRLVGASLPQKPEGVVIQSVRQVKLFRQLDTLTIEIERIVFDFMKVTDFALAHRSEEPFKAAIQCRIPPLPFADHHGLVASLLKHFADADALVEVYRIIPAMALMANLLAIQPCQ